MHNPDDSASTNEILACPSPDEPLNGKVEPLIRCVQCGLEVEKRLAKDGEYCFECAVHSTCACEDARQ